MVIRLFAHCGREQYALMEQAVFSDTADKIFCRMKNVDTVDTSCEKGQSRS